jgi:VanZ family protein
MLIVFDILGLILYCALIYWLSDQPYIPITMLFESQDKFHHFSAYFVMSMFAWRCLRHLGISSSLLAMASIVFCSLYGISDEWHQSFVEGRNSDSLDWLADTIGACIGMLVLGGFFRYKKTLSLNRGKAI